MLQGSIIVGLYRSQSQSQRQNGDSFNDRATGTRLAVRRPQTKLGHRIVDILVIVVISLNEYKGVLVMSIVNKGGAFRKCSGGLYTRC